MMLLPRFHGLQMRFDGADDGRGLAVEWLGLTFVIWLGWRS